MSAEIQSNNLLKIKTEYDVQTKIDWFLASLKSLVEDYCEVFEYDAFRVEISYNFQAGQFTIVNKALPNLGLTEQVMILTPRQLKDAILSKSQDIYHNDASRLKGVDKKEKLAKKVFKWQTQDFLNNLDNTLKRDK